MRPSTQIIRETASDIGMPVASITATPGFRKRVTEARYIAAARLKYEHYSHKQIAELLHCSPGSAKTFAHRGRDMT